MSLTVSTRPAHTSQSPRVTEADFPTYCRTTPQTPEILMHPDQHTEHSPVSVSLLTWRSRLHDRLRERPYPLFLFAETIIPAASVWTGARLWIAAFRQNSLVAGSRVLLALPPSPAFLQVLVAALWEGLTIALAPATRDRTVLETLAEELDTQVILAECHDPIAGFWEPEGCEGPRTETITLRPPRLALLPEVRFLLRTSGTTGNGRWIGLTDTGILSVLDSHLPRLELQEAETRVLSALPWHHAFGLVLDLLPALFTGAEIVRDSCAGRDAPALVRLGQEMGSTHFSAVPLTLKRIRSVPGGVEFLRKLEGGIVGGAPVDADLAAFLATTRLRAGYGQTEASPGIALGEPGYWPGPHYLGRACGCSVRRDERGVLHFRGENAARGVWHREAGLTPVSASAWVDTGDIVTVTPAGDFFFCGRADAAFKLTNGLRVEAALLEEAVRHACPEVRDALLFSPDGETLHLGICLYEGSSLPDLSRLREALGKLGSRLTQGTVFPPEQWLWTPKGTLQRQRTLDLWSSLGSEQVV